MLFSVVFSIIGCAMLFGSLILLLLFGEMFTADIPKQILISELPKNSSLATTIQTHHQSMIIMLEGVVMLMWLTSTILFGLLFSQISAHKRELNNVIFLKFSSNWMVFYGCKIFSLSIDEEGRHAWRHARVYQCWNLKWKIVINLHHLIIICSFIFPKLIALTFETVICIV